MGAILKCATLSVLMLGLMGPRVSAQVTVEHQDFNSSISWVETSYDGNNNDTQTADWSVETSGANPSCSPHEGNRMALFNSYYADTGDESRIRSDSRDLTGAEVAEARFWMYRDGGDQGHNDFVRFQLSTDGGDSYFTMRLFYRYTAGATGWQEKVIPLGYYTTESDVRFALRAESRGGNNIFIDDLIVTKATLPAGAEGKACAAGGECDSGICGVDPFGAGRCRDAGTVCIGANREPVGAGQTVCAGPDLASCTGSDSWNTTDCYDDCGAYLDVHQCEHNGSAFVCAGCVEECIDLFGITEGCDPDAWCDFSFFWSECIRKVADGTACGANKECLSDNCVASPGGQKFCAPAGTDCVDGAGQPVSSGQAICAGGDRYECQAVGWAHQDCYTNCGFYDDVDSCSQGVCDACADSCNDDGDCKPNIVCTAGECVGGLDLGSTCQLDSQCDSDHCIDGRCCQDICSAPCHRCDVDDSGVCRAIPDGQDPDGECPGQAGACEGSCNGLGGCNFPEGAVCDVCARCDAAGRCLSFVPAGTDPADECPACQVCNGSQAACTPVSAGEDPVGDCSEAAPESCGLDGNCDGAGACRFWVQGTSCGQSSCSGGVEQGGDACDGAGLCVDGGTRNCAPYRCADAERCAADCDSHSGCVPEAFCAAGGACLADLGEGADCAGVVYPGLLDDAACLNGYCFDDDFDGLGAFCTLNPNGCVHDGEVFPSGYALCEGEAWYKICEGGVPGWGDEINCQAGTCDAGGGAGSGVRSSGSCTSGPGGGCSSACESCEPYMAQDAATCLSGCTGDEDCWPSYTCLDGACVVPEGIGDPCESQADCQAGICVDGRCCENSCTGACRACNLPGREGFCSHADQGLDPDGDCEPEPAESCGTTGVCDGYGACQLWPADQVCAAAHCEGSWFVHEAVCDGAGHCVPAAQDDCRPGTCAGMGCQGSCAQHADCDPTGFCGQAGQCEADLADGEACQDVVFGDLESDPACAGGYCYPDSWTEAGAYCASAVDVCVAAGESYPPGYRLCAEDPWLRVCLGGGAGWGPAVDCAPAGVCDAGGGPGSGVVPAEQCRSGPEGGCEATCESCYPYRASSPGQCAGMCGEDADCWPGHACVGGACEPDGALGQACADEADCDGFACVDGVCCNLACDTNCLLCNDPIALGVCLPAEAGTDPAADCDEETVCGQTGQCDGTGACAVQAAGRVCAPGTCSDGVRTSPGLCDGRGRCEPGLEHACPSGLCLGDVCAPQVQTDGGQDADGGDADGDAPVVELRAEAGPIQVVRPGSEVVLDGSASAGPEGVSLTYLWEQTSGPTQVELSGSTTARPGFTAQTEGVYGFRLVVGDGQAESPPDFTEVHVLKGGGGCGCGAGPIGGWLGWLLLAGCWLTRRRALLMRTCALVWAGLCVLALGGCGDDIRGSLRLLVVPPHQGRAPVQDPFSLVDKVEIGLTATDGSYRSLGRHAPLSRFGPGLVGSAGSGAPTLIGLNERARPVSLGFGSPVTIEAGLDAFVSVSFARVDYAVAHRLRAIDADQPAPWSSLPPALRLDAANLEQGQLDGDGDAACLVWIGWTDAGLLFRARLTDDDYAPAGIGSPADGDAAVLYIDPDGDPAVAPGEEIVVTIGADGRVEPEGILSGVQAQAVAGGWELEATLAGGGWQKNQQLGFDLRMIDADAQGTSLLTWAFDPLSQGDDPTPERYGRLIMGVPLLDLVGQDGPRLALSVPEGVVDVSGRWDLNQLNMRIDVPDDEVRPSGQAGGLDQADRVAIWLDLGNGEAAPEGQRFQRLTVSAGGNMELAAGPDPGNVTDLGLAFSGQVTATTRADGYTIELTWPWADLQLDDQPQRGWFLGLEVEIYDEDADGLELHSLSDGVGQPGLWSELRLFAVE